MTNSNSPGDSREILRAQSAGFCMGVSLALKRLDSVTTRGERGAAARPILTLGPIIHNPQVLARYEALGVGRVNDPERIHPPCTVVIRAHGVPQRTESLLRERGAAIVDATCPKVKRAQLSIDQESRSGRTLLLFGEEDHPEVRGLVSYARAGALVFDSLEALRALLHGDAHTPPLDRTRGYFLAAQTTQDRSVFEAVVSLLRRELDAEMPVYATICNATRERQEEALALADEVDAMVVVGGFESGNTRRLVDMARSRNVPCQHVETAADLDAEALRSARRIGLTAGASTPKELIDAVEERLRDLAAPLA